MTAATFGAEDRTFGGPEPLPAGTGALAAFRQLVASALAGVDGVAVHRDVVDSVTPPAYLLVWPDQALQPWTGCYYRARLQVLCVGPRMDPAPGYESVESLVEHAVLAFDQAALTHEPVGAFLPFQIGGVSYLAARITVVGTISLEVT